jgi:hypothetical protein
MDGGGGRQQQAVRWAALTALEDRVQAAPAGAGRVHAQLLRDLIDLAGAYSAEGQSLSVSPQVAVLLRCSGAKADRVLGEASVLVELPDGLAALEQGVLTVEQSAVVARELGRVPDLATRLAVWRRLLTRLQADVSAGAALPAPRLRELLRRWVLELAPKDVQEQREQAAAERRVEYRRREDGLTDLLLFGVDSTLAQAVLHRIRTSRQPVGLFGRADRRSAPVGRRSRPAARPSGQPPAARTQGLARPSSIRPAATAGGHAGAGAGALAGAGTGAAASGTPVPCGAQLLVHVPLGAALGTTGRWRSWSGTDRSSRTCCSSCCWPRRSLRAVHVDAAGVPCRSATGAPAGTPRPASRPGGAAGRGREPPGERIPAPADHRTHTDSTRQRAAVATSDPGPSGQVVNNHRAEVTGAVEAHADRILDTPGCTVAAGHPPDSPGAYRPSRRLRRLIDARAPRCEFPGCGARAEVCDAEHDDAWPTGPTCACNLGPCCRRHHRTKQEGWTKQRLQHAAVRWTSPTGRAWTSPPQHPAPTPALRPLRAVPATDPWDELDPISLERLLWELDDRPDDLAPSSCGPSTSTRTIWRARMGSASCSAAEPAAGASSSTTPTPGR